MIDEDNLLTREEMEKKYPGKKITKCEVYSRVVGYLRPVDQWNLGKQQEYKDRKNYKMDGKRHG